MSSLWNWVKRHRGKIIVTGAVAGGAYLAKRFLDENPELVSALRGLSGQRNALEESLKRDYVFQAQQRSADASLEELSPRLLHKAQQRWDLEAQAAAVRDARDLSAAEKRSAWERMKAECMCRLLGAAYAEALLLLSLKTQMSILAGLLYKASQARAPPIQELRTSVSGVWSWLTGSVESGPSGSGAGGGGDEIVRSAFEAPSAEAQQLFLQSLQYFVLVGSGRLWERVEEAVRGVLGSVSLSARVDEEGLKSLIERVRTGSGLEREGALGIFVVPLAESGGGMGDSFSLGLGSGDGSLARLLNLHRRWMSTPEASDVLRSIVDARIDAALSMARDQSGGLLDEGLPMARLVPLLSDAFKEMKESSSQVLLNRPLAAFAKRVFDEGDTEPLNLPL